MGEPVAQRGLGERAGLLAHGGEVQRAAGRLDLKRRRQLGHGRAPRGALVGRGKVDRHAAPRVWERFAEERPLLRPEPAGAFEPRRVQPVSLSRSALVRVEGAWYSVPSRWAGLVVTAYIGVDELTLRCRGEDVVHPGQRFGGRRVDYRHYLAELARKPQAVRQVAPELVAALGEPFGRLWSRL